MELKQVALVIVDISGYTRFIKFHKTGLIHAQEVISRLLDSPGRSTKKPTMTWVQSGRR